MKITYKLISRLLFSLFISCALLCSLICCGDRVSETYKLDTGDVVRISIDKNANYLITPETPFTIYQKDHILAYGMFVDKNSAKLLMEAVEKDGGAATEVFETGHKGELVFMLYGTDSKEGKEYNYIIQINNSNTGVILGSTLSKEAVEQAFEMIKIEIVQ